MSKLQSWPWQPGSIWCEEEREDLGFGSEREERERENRKGERRWVLILFFVLPCFVCCIASKEMKGILYCKYTSSGFWCWGLSIFAVGV